MYKMGFKLTAMDMTELAFMKNKHYGYSIDNTTHCTRPLSNFCLKVLQQKRCFSDVELTIKGRRVLFDSEL